MRLDKFLANAGIGTRKEVKQLIKKKRVTVNGVIQTKDDSKVDEKRDEICVDAQQVVYQKYVYYMLNKPQGVISATFDERHQTVLDCFDEYLPLDVFPVGRLDIDTEGLLLISNDGELAHRLLSPKSHCDKTYYVKCEKPLTSEMIDRLQKRIECKDETFEAGIVEKISDDEIYLTIQEGKFHQVKRMVHHVGNEVIFLKRVRMGSLRLDEKLHPGEYRPLTIDEIIELGGKV